MNFVNLIISLLSGAVGGNVAGAAMKDKSLGTLGNSLSGILGGGIGGGSKLGGGIGDFVERYIFPGGELDHIGMSVANLERHGFEVHDVEAWREHYARTTRLWHDRLLANFAAAEREVGAVKTRMWLIYLAGVSIAFDRAKLGIFRIGTARGSDDQEGRALALEKAAGLFDGHRRREIALRHAAARAVEDRADFVATARLLLDRAAALCERCLELGDAPARYAGAIGAGTFLALGLLASIRSTQHRYDEAVELLERSLAGDRDERVHLGVVRAHARK